VAAGLCSCWKAAGQLLEGWKYSSLNQGGPKSMKHKRKRRGYVRISETGGLKAYKQIYQSFTRLQGPSQCQNNTLYKRYEHLVTFNHLSSDYIMIMGFDNVHQQQTGKNNLLFLLFPSNHRKHGCHCLATSKVQVLFRCFTLKVQVRFRCFTEKQA